MTLQEAKSIVRHLGLTLRKVRSGDYCVRSREGNEPTPYYTDDLEDAVNTAVRMVRTATMMNETTATQATPFSGCHQQTFGAQEQIPARGKATSQVWRCFCRGNIQQRDGNVWENKTTRRAAVVSEWNGKHGESHLKRWSG